MTTDEIVRALGGREPVAERCGVSPQAVSNWRRDGVPFRHFVALVSMAAERGVRLTFDHLAATRPTREAA